MLIHNAVECSSGFRILTSQSALGWLWCNVRKATRKCHLVLDQVITLKLKAQIQPELNSATTEIPGECMVCHEATLWRHCWLQWNCQISNIWKYFRFLVSAPPISTCLRRGPRDYFRSECCTGGESVAAPRVELPHTCTLAEKEAVKVPDFGLTRAWVEPVPPASYIPAHSAVPHSRPPTGNGKKKKIPAWNCPSAQAPSTMTKS